jgi:hypothetical protein
MLRREKEAGAFGDGIKGLIDQGNGTGYQV